MRPTWNPAPPPFASRLIVVGGQCSKVGKTLLAAELMIALRDFEWTAVKITPHAESGCPVNGSGCGCSSTDHTFAIREELDPDAAADTSRFLAAGAKRAFWVQTKPGELCTALLDLAATLQTASNVIIESNAILEFWRPAGLVMVLDPAKPDFKTSAARILPFADAFVLRSPLSDSEAQPGGHPSLPNRPIFLQPLGTPLPKGVQDVARQLVEHLAPSGAWWAGWTPHGL